MLGRFVVLTSCFALSLTACGGSSSSSGSGGAGSGGATGGSGGATGGSGGAAGGSGGATGGTGGTGGATGGTGGATGGTGGAGGSESCTTADNGALGISVHCTFTLAEAAAGISIPYAVVIAQDVTNVVPEAQATCVQPDASGLYPFEQITGNGNAYCLCDNGFCPAPPQTPVTLKAGSYPGTFSWDGVNWSGPSDTGNPKGAAFPAGSYTLSVSATGMQAGQQFKAEGTLQVTLTP
jgi:hypothetical protein